MGMDDEVQERLRRLYRELGRLRAQLRRRRRGVCPVCGQPWEGIGRRTYCSPRCRWRAYYRRHREEVLERRRRRRRGDG